MNTAQPQVILSGFADEAAIRKSGTEQFAAFAALGLQYYSIRFIDIGRGVKNVMQLTKSEITKVRNLQSEYGLNVTSLGSPIGKVKLVNVRDGTKNRFVPFNKYLTKDVRKACELAHAFETKLIRGFSFYPPKGKNPSDYISQTVDQLGQIAEMCHRSDLTYGIEVEANLVGQNGHLLQEIYKKVNHPALMLIFDAANILVQGYSTAQVYEQYQAMKSATGWMHIKDYTPDPHGTRQEGHVDEDALTRFVPADQGEGIHELVLRDFKEAILKLERKLKRRGIPGVFLDLEPHVKGGGQFGGFSGPDGMGVALRGLCRLLDYLSIGYHLRDFEDIQAARGF
ncbi:MAG: sugar phosphate isomerase/epimerase [Pirellulaceae bacterium]|nr:sugar phosphate isomerase/epimerase [Pirellulaceae bacterium]